MNDDVYWNNFYKIKPSLHIPTQFAAFTANEIASGCQIIELGCGNGRDALFFGRHGFNVYAIDSSSEAIKSCREKAQDGETFEVFDIVNNELWAEIQRRTQSSETIIYSRFFLHALEDEQQVNMLKNLSILQNKTRIFLEFRTKKDAERQKVTAKHFRNFIDLGEFEKLLLKFNFSILNTWTGLGYAKFKTDDAYVARYIIEVNS